MKEDSTRITIRIKKDLLTDFRKIFPYRGELTSFITCCIEQVCALGSGNPMVRLTAGVNIGHVKERIVGER